MHELTTFEQRLVQRLEAELGAEVTRFDAARIAATAMQARTRRDRILNRLGLGGAMPLPATSRRLILVFVAAALVLATVALAVGLARLGSQRLALIRTNGDVVVANADGSDERVIGRVPASPLRNVVSWAPGGEYLAIFGEDWQLGIMDRTGGVSHTMQLEDRLSQFAWSPNGRLAILDGAWLPADPAGGPPIVAPHLDLIGPDGALEWAVPLPPDFRYVAGQGWVAWSADGQQLAITGFRVEQQQGDPSSIWIVDVRARTVRQIETSGGPANDHTPRWVPDGGVIFWRQDSGVWRVDPATGAESIVLDLGRPCCGSGPLEPSPDGSKVAFVAPDGGLAILDLATGIVTDVQLSVGAVSPPFEWTADGAALTMLWGEATGGPFVPTYVATIDVATGELAILAADVLAYDLLP